MEIMFTLRLTCRHLVAVLSRPVIIPTQKLNTFNVTNRFVSSFFIGETLIMFCNDYIIKAYMWL